MLPYRGPKKVIEMLTPSKTMISQAESNTNWKGLYRVGGVAALIQVVLMLIQIIIFFAWPPPTTVTGYFTLFENNWLLGLLSLDLIAGSGLLLAFTVWVNFALAAFRRAMVLAMGGGVLSMAWHILTARRLFWLGRTS